MLSGRSRLFAAAGLAYAAVLASQCSKAAPAPAAPAAATTPPPAASKAAATPQMLIGEMKPVYSVKQFMEYVIDPLSDNVFDAVVTDIGPKGIVDKFPKTDDDWERVRTGAASIAEAIYLLKVPRAFTPPGDVNNSTGPNAPELSPTQIQAKLDADPVLWNAKIEALRNVCLEVMDIVKKRDPKQNQSAVNELFEASEDLDNACEGCHLEYWYPGDRAAVDEDKRQRARIEPTEKRSRRSEGKPAVIENKK